MSKSWLSWFTGDDVGAGETPSIHDDQNNNLLTIEKLEKEFFNDLEESSYDDIVPDITEAKDKGKEKFDPEKEQIFLSEIKNEVTEVTNEDTIDDITFTVIEHTTPEAPVVTYGNVINNKASDLANGHTQAYSSSALTNLNTGLICFANVGTNITNFAVSVYYIKNDLGLISTLVGAAQLVVNVGAPTVAYILGDGVVGVTATYFTHGAVALAATHPLAIPVVATALVAAYDYQTLINTAKSGIDITVSFAKGTAALASAGVDTVVIPAAMILDLYNIGKNGIKLPHFPVKFDGKTITLALTDQDEATTIDKEWVAVTDEANPTPDDIDFSKMQDTVPDKQVNNLGQIIEFTDEGFIKTNNLDTSIGNINDNSVGITGSDSMLNAN